MNRPTLESVAKALLIVNQKDVLVLTIGDHKLRPHRSFKPDLPGGQVDPGENEHEAVVREIIEEAGVEVDLSQLTPVYSRTALEDDGGKSVTKHLFIVELDEVPEVNLSWEHTAYEWIPLDELPDQDLGSFYTEAVQYCFSSGIIAEPTTKSYSDPGPIN